MEHQIGNIPTAKRATFIVDKQGIVRFKRIMSPSEADESFLRNAVLLNELVRINNQDN